jgi:hypothetical protein
MVKKSILNLLKKRGISSLPATAVNLTLGSIPSSCNGAFHPRLDHLPNLALHPQAIGNNNRSHILTIRGSAPSPITP